MNIQRFKWPAIIAASLHGALFLVSKEPETTFTPPTGGAVIPLSPIPQDEPVAMPPEHTDEPVGGAAGASVTPPPVLPEPPREPVSRDAFTVPVSPTAPSRAPVPTLTGFTGLPFDSSNNDGILNGRPALPGVQHLDRTPRAVVQPSPGYPEELRREGVDGEVVVEFVVDTEGRVVKAEAVRWTRREFASQAVKAVLRWRFQPGTLGGRPVSFRIAVPIVFNPEG